MASKDFEPPVKIGPYCCWPKYKDKRFHIGEGSFGDVYKAVDKFHRVYAAKRLKNDFNLCEIIPEKLSHTNVISYYCVKTIGARLHMVMEYCDCDLHQYLSEENRPLYGEYQMMRHRFTCSCSARMRWNTCTEKI